MGYIRLNVDVLNSAAFGESGLWHLYSYLLMRACRREMVVRGVRVGVGQCVFSASMLAEKLECRRQTVMERLVKLEKAGCIVVSQQGQAGSLITIVDYDVMTGGTAGGTAGGTESVLHNNNGNKEDKSSDMFIKPTLDEVRDYVREKCYEEVDAEHFWNFYEAKGWMIGKNMMKDWHCAVATWRKNVNESRTKRLRIKTGGNSYESGENRIDREARKLYDRLQSAYVALRSGDTVTSSDADVFSL